MEQPLISVIMPAFNAEEFIKESIESIISQTYTNWELIVIDDGSTDNTKTIIDTFKNRHKNIHYYYQPNGRQGKARNVALKEAKGEFAAFIDADDIWLPNKLAQQVSDIAEKDVALIFSDAYMFNDSTQMPKKLIGSGKGFYSAKNGLEQFLAFNRIPTSTVLASIAAIRQVNGFTESSKIPQAEDYHLWLKLLINGFRFYGSEAVLGGYRLHPASSSNEDKLAVRYVIEAFEDLKKTYAQYSTLINDYQKKWFNRYHYSTNRWQKKDYKKLIEKNCVYLKKSYLLFIFSTLYFFTGITITRKIMTKFVN